MDNSQKRRKYKRIEKLYMTKVRVKQHEYHETVSTGWNVVTLRDLGAAGLFFYSKKDLRLGSLLDFKIDISDYPHTINCIGEIIRIEKSNPPSKFGIATEFTGIEEQEKDIINKTVEENLE
jgi:hypothetical protein